MDSQDGPDMTWKEELRQLEYKEDWDTAIEYMGCVIQANPNGMDAYIYMNYLVMNLLVEENHNNLQHDLEYYAKLANHYFDISYAKYSENAEYLFYTGITAVMSEWYFGIEPEDYNKMLIKAMQLEPSNPVYHWKYIIHLKEKDTANHKELNEYYAMVLNDDSEIRKILEAKGAIGQYILGMMTTSAKDFLAGKYY